MTKTADYKYDVFVSYSHADQAWVEGELLPRLETSGIRYIDQLQFELGHPKLDEIERAVVESRKSLLIISLAYLDSSWGQFDSILASSYGLDIGEWPAIPVMIQPCELPKRLKVLVSLDLSESDEDSWQRLVNTLLPHKKHQPTHLFISYKRNANPDQDLANYLHNFLTAKGYNVFIDNTLRTGDMWLDELDQHIRASDFLVALLSKESADSEMVQAEVRRAYQYRKLQGHPHMLPLRIAYEGLLPYSIDAFIDQFQYLVWNSDADNQRVAQQILAAIEDRLPKSVPIQPSPVVEGLIISEDGRPVADDETPHPPLPEFDPRFLEGLEAPGGAVKLRDKFYVVREADARLKTEVVRLGTTTTIRASRQTGKTSLLVRGVHHARENGAKVVNLDVQRVDGDHLKTSDTFLRYLAEFIVRKLRLDQAEVERQWRSSLGPQDKLTNLIEDYVLPASNVPIVLAMDEVDRLLQTPFHSDFFGMVRSWHNNRALDEKWDQLNIVMVISTEPYLLIADTTLSPFNVGLRLFLKDFNESQVHGLNRQHHSPVQESDFPQLMGLLNGHPYLTRKALYTLITERMTWTDLTRVAATDQGPFGDHLRHHHWLLRDEPTLKQALKQVIRDNCCRDKIAFFRLLRAGLVKGVGDVCKCRCDLYRIYFEDKL